MPDIKTATMVTKDNDRRERSFDESRLRNFIANTLEVSSDQYTGKVIRSITNKPKISSNNITEELIKTALEYIDEADPSWTYVAAKAYLRRLYKQASRNRSYADTDKYGNFFGLLKTLGSKGVYASDILKKYSQEEIAEAGEAIDPEKDQLFDFPGIQLFTSRYLAKDYDGAVYELPQERYMIIALHLMQDEPENDRMYYVHEAYWAMSNHYMTVATPTLANAGKSHGQLSSCFIDTVDDSLTAIYDSNTDIARLSKNGGGIGVYMGKIRAKDSSIQGYPGKSGGIVPWIKQLNNTAVSVDQLGTRKGAVAVYLDVWHQDINAFLDLRLNNGDPRKRARDVFTGVTLPDYFMEKVEQRGEWYLFDPHEVRDTMGFSLEDFYDEEKGKGSFREKYEQCVQCNDLSKTKVQAIDIMKRIMKAQLEGGTPFMFYRDEVNRQNANSHQGMIYCSNLCTEITQNQSPTEQISETVGGENGDEIIIRKKSGDYVTCNLSSMHLGRAVPDNVLERLTRIQVRMLDNVIDVNELPIKQTEITNKRYRAVGLGTFSWHHLLALKGIQWESEEAVQYADELYESIAYYTIQASMELAKERGAYPYFNGSDWQTGEYFRRKGYVSRSHPNKDAWETLMNDVANHGIRNGYLMAVAPNASTSVIAHGTASIDPVFGPMFYEEKNDYKLPIVAPDMNPETYDVYRRSSYKVDQRMSVRQNAARQKHVDQSLSFNIYVPHDIDVRMLLDVHLLAWQSGLKTTYYTRSTATEIGECEWCES